MPGSTNTYQFNFASNVDFGLLDIGLGSASIWFSWRNITEAKQNNKFSIIMPTFAGSTTLNLTVPDGGYEITDLNNYLRYFMVTNGYYIQNNTTNEQIVYCEFVTNPSTYSVQFNSYPLPTSLPSGYTAGPSITFPTTSKGPQLVVTQSAFGDIIGFNTGTFPSSIPTVLTSTASTKTPVVSDVTNVLIMLDSANNPFAANSKIIHSISPAGYKYASLIKSDPYEIAWIPQQSGWRQSITLQLVNQNFIPLDQVDTDLTIKLLVRYRPTSQSN